MYLKLDFQFPACELASVVYGLCAPPSGQIYVDGIIYRTTLKSRTHYLIYKLTTIWMKSHHGRTQSFHFLLEPGDPAGHGVGTLEETPPSFRPSAYGQNQQFTLRQVMTMGVHSNNIRAISRELALIVGSCRKCFLHLMEKVSQAGLIFFSWPVKAARLKLKRCQSFYSSS